MIEKALHNRILPESAPGLRSKPGSPYLIHLQLAGFSTDFLDIVPDIMVYQASERDNAPGKSALRG